MKNLRYILAMLMAGMAITTQAQENDMESLQISFKADSSAISKVEYNGETQTMLIYFTNSDTGYAFYNVPRRVVVEFQAAESQGKYYNTHIRGQYSDDD